MRITSEGFDYSDLRAGNWDKWARSVVEGNKKLRPMERFRLLGVLNFPDSFVEGFNEYLFYKALRTSEDDLAKEKAGQLAGSCARFGRMENFLAMRERREMERNVIPFPLVRRKVQQIFVFRPANAVGFGVFLGLHPTPISPIFRSATQLRVASPASA